MEEWRGSEVHLLRDPEEVLYECSIGAAFCGWREPSRLPGMKTISSPELLRLL
ncbi:hypothetical protein [Paenibacillus sonchi]|uniref:hypothetical protein n=1 Tax=Paenibacillus sonchi TaxID=373687 RepID=UPI00398A5282